MSTNRSRTVPGASCVQGESWQHVRPPPAQDDKFFVSSHRRGWERAMHIIGQAEVVSSVWSPPSRDTQPDEDGVTPNAGSLQSIGGAPNVNAAARARDHRDAGRRTENTTARL